MKNVSLFTQIILLALLVSTCKLDETITRNPPQASFTVQNNGCTAPCNVAFKSTSQHAETHSWDFGDGSPKDEASDPTHLFQESGTYKVILTVTASDPSGTTLTDTASTNITILRSANDPIASFSVDKTDCAAPCDITITNSSSNTSSYSWDFGDNNTGNQTASSFTHTYSDAGMYTITMTATGPNGSDEADPITINVNQPIPPVALFEVDSMNHNGFAPSLVIFKNTSTDADSYIWDFFDPTSGADNTSSEENPEHTFRNSGDYFVKLIAKNSLNGLEDEYQMKIEVEDPITFITQFDAGGDETGYSITRRKANGQYAITGDTRLGLTQDLWFLTTNSLGDVLLDETFGNRTLPDQGHSVLINKNGEFVITGITGFIANVSNLWLLILDNNATILADEKFSGGTGFSNGGGRSIIETFSGEYAITGNISNGSNSDLWLLVTDANGNASVDEKFGGGGGSTDIGHGVVQTSQGEYAMIGQTDAGANQILLFVTDELGTKQFSKVYAGSSGNALVETANGGFAITGCRNNKLLILTTEADGTVRVPKEYPETAGNACGYDIIRTMDGGFAAVGNAHNGANDDVYLVVTDANGNKLFDKFIPVGNSSDIGYSVYQTADGGFAITGATNNGANLDVLFIKTDANGNVN